MKVRYGIQISHWEFSFNAEHYYGKAWMSGSTSGQLDVFDVEKPLTAAEAKYLNTKDSWSSWTEGDMSYRFDTVKEAVEWGVKELYEKYGEDIDIELGASYYDDNEIYEDGMDFIAWFRRYNS